LSGDDAAPARKLAEEPAALARKTTIEQCQGTRVRISKGECCANRFGRQFIAACLP
jgi:hypothetical protein